jgi:hypothetical protein
MGGGLDNVNCLFTGLDLIEPRRRNLMKMAILLKTIKRALSE